MEKNIREEKSSNAFSFLKTQIANLNSALNHDFCPSANQYVYWLKQPVGWVVCGAGFSAVVGFLIGPQGFVLMWSFLALLVIGAVWPWLSMKRIECQLIFDRSRVEENGTAAAIIEITNKWPVPVFGLMVEGKFLLDLIDDDEVAVGLQRVPGWSVSRFSWNFEPKQRGVLPVDEPSLTNGFPFGLYRSSRKIKIKRQTIVWPECSPLQGIPGLDGAQFNIAGMMSDRSGIDGDVIGVRQYRQGDSLKHMHWSKTASSGQMMVQERQTCAQRPFEVLLDLTPASHRGQGSQSSFEWAIRVASSICTQLHKHQVHLDLICLGLPRQHPFQVSNINGIGQVLDFLAKLPQQDEIEITGLRSSIANSGSNVKRFVICTNHSSTASAFCGAQLIELAAEAFANDKFESSVDQPTSVQLKSVIQLPSPDLAVSNLKAGWEQGMCNGS